MVKNLRLYSYIFLCSIQKKKRKKKENTSDIHDYWPLSERKPLEHEFLVPADSSPDEVRVCIKRLIKIKCEGALFIW